MRFTLIALLAWLMLSACKKTDPIIIKHKPLTFNHESTRTVISFLTWYQKNYDAVNQFRLINNYTANDSDEVAAFYSVNFSETEKYLLAIKESGYVSDHYIKERRNYFLECDLNFRSNPQNDGPPSGFEFDFIVWNQEPVYTLAEIKNIKLMSVKTTPTHSRIKIDLSPPVKFDLTLNNGKWLIDDIRGSTPDE